ncbi:hypothetical protein HPY42_05265 [Coprothermobacteraceae bacterium]|nr:hypothetical protein [Coprothermobacteraceae bacterium]
MGKQTNGGGAKRRLLVFVEQPSNTTGCATVDLKEIGDFVVSPKGDDPVRLAEVLRYLRDRHPEIEVNLVDPRNTFFFWQVVKHRVKGGRATWVLDGKKVYEGIPTIEVLEELLAKR